jgi:glycosyltransferase involved in cell wall biosynthesis
MTKKLLIVEEALRSPDNGHWFEYTKAIVAGCRDEDVDVTTLAHRDATPGILQTLNARALIPCSAWDGSYAGGALKRYAGVFAHNARLHRAVAAFLEKSEPFDALLAPTILVHHLLAWLRIARRFGGKKIRRMTLLFLNAPGNYDAHGALRFPRSSLLMKIILRRFAPLVRDGVVTLAAETRRTAEHLKTFCDIDFTTAAQPIALPSFANTSHPSPTFGSFGFARHEQGSDILQNAVKIFLERNPKTDARFLIRWTRDFAGPDGKLITRDAALTKNPNVEFLGASRSTAEYAEQFARADALILPYRLSSYRDRGSRVAAEAAMLGVPMIFARGTWLEELVTRCGAGAAFRDEDASDLVRAIGEMATNIERHKGTARVNAEKARNYFSPRSFVRRLFDGTSAQCDGVSF